MDAHGGAPSFVYWKLSDTYLALTIPGSTFGRRLSGLVSAENAKSISIMRNKEPHMPRGGIVDPCKNAKVAGSWISHSIAIVQVAQ
jgi:hypothetical protein